MYMCIYIYMHIHRERYYNILQYHITYDVREIWVQHPNLCRYADILYWFVLRRYANAPI